MTATAFGSASSIGRLQGIVAEVSHIEEHALSDMFRLMDQHYLGVTWPQFVSDLSEKRWAVLLMDQDRSVHGFSTITSFPVTVANETFTAYFSGDTIVEPAYRGQRELPQTWLRFLMHKHNSTGIGRAYWFLISSGYKTYRFLPVFVREFYPHPHHMTPSRLQTRLNAMAQLRYGNNYDPAKGIISLDAPTPLRPGVADVETRHKKDEFIEFFVRRNPHHDRGEELACIAALEFDNLTPAGKRLLTDRC